jgi:hypothetical protein
MSLIARSFCGRAIAFTTTTNPSPVIPAQAGIHKPVDIAHSAWIPACAGMTGDKFA